MAIASASVLFSASCGTKEDQQVIETKPRAVRIETILSRDLPVVIHSVGRLAPNKEVVLSAQASGILREYNADVGINVAAGQQLVKLDPVDYTLALNEAEANLLAARIRLERAKKSFERTKRLLPGNAITEEIYEQSEAEFKSSSALVTQLQTLVAQAQRRLDKTIITAPFDGYVTQRFVEIGQNVAIGDPVMNLADMKTMRVKIYINELEYVYLDKSDPVTVTVDAFSQSPIEGSVDKIGIQADARTNTFEVEILVDNQDVGLKAGLTARVDIQTGIIPDAVMIAQDSVIYRENRKEVFVIEKGDLAAVREIQLGRIDGSRVRVLSGLMPGDRLVTEGGQYLKPGDKVVVDQ